MKKYVAVIWNINLKKYDVAVSWNSDLKKCVAVSWVINMKNYVALKKNQYNLIRNGKTSASNIFIKSQNNMQIHLFEKKKWVFPLMKRLVLTKCPKGHGEEGGVELADSVCEFH